MSTRILPSLTFQIIFPNYNQSTLSYIPPYNYLDIKFSSNVNYKHFLCNATFEDEDYGIGVGAKVAEYTNGTAWTPTTFRLTSNTHLLNGMGTYRIGLYVESMDGTWNYYYIFATVGHSYVKTTENKFLGVVAEGDIT